MSWPQTLWTSAWPWDPPSQVDLFILLNSILFYIFIMPGIGPRVLCLWESILALNQSQTQDVLFSHILKGIH